MSTTSWRCAGFPRVATVRHLSDHPGHPAAPVAAPRRSRRTGAGGQQHSRHRFWADNFDYSAVSWHGLLGHRQVTDAYLAALARHHQGRLATLNRGLAALHSEVVEWLSG